MTYFATPGGAALRTRVIEHAARLAEAEEVLRGPGDHDDATVLDAARFMLTHSHDPMLIAAARGLIARIGRKPS